MPRSGLERTANVSRNSLANEARRVSRRHHVSRANRRDDSGKSMPVTNQATAPHPIATRIELGRKAKLCAIAGPCTVVIAAPATTQRAAIHW